MNVRRLALPCSLCPAQPCPALSALRCLALPCPALPCPVLPCAALFCAALHCTALLSLSLTGPLCPALLSWPCARGRRGEALHTPQEGSPGGVAHAAMVTCMLALILTTFCTSVLSSVPPSQHRQAQVDTTTKGAGRACGSAPHERVKGPDAMHVCLQHIHARSCPGHAHQWGLLFTGEGRKGGQR